MAKNRLGLCLSLERNAPSQYGNYNFNSMCSFRGMLLGANEDGLFVLDNGDLDNDEKINSIVRLVTTDWGIPNIKRLRKLLIGYECDGALEVRVYADESDPTKINVQPTHSNLREHSQKVSVGRDIRGRYWSVEIRNVNGADFSIDSISAIPIILGTKPEEGV